MTTNTPTLRYARDAVTRQQPVFATSENHITKSQKKKMFQFKRKVSHLSDDVVNNESVELCDGPDGCGYAKSSCICEYLKKKKDSGPSTGGDTSIGRGFGQTYNLDEQ